MSNVFPISYFGPIAYYRQLVSTKQFFIEQHETYVKQTIRNRMTIYSSNGSLDLSIPVKKVYGNKTITKDIQISYDENWVKNHWKALESAYMHTPYFEHYGSEVFQLISSKETSLYKFNLSILNSIIQWLDLEVDFKCTQSYSKNVGKDFRDFNFSDPNNNDQFVYYQVFSGNHGFLPNLSILDLLFHEGPLARKYLLD